MARQVEAGNIVEELQRNGASTLVELAVKAGLADTLTGPGPFTIFAPTNAAFAALPADLVAAVTADTELLKSVLLYHAVAGEVTSDMASNDIKLDTVEGNPLLVNVYTKNYYHGLYGSSVSCLLTILKREEQIIKSILPLEHNHRQWKEGYQG